MSEPDESELHKQTTITITISRTLADVLAHEWIPLDDEDPMIELFDACREAVER
jgi:hypothetical protein